MTDRIHDDEPDTSERVVRSLLRAECPQWADASLTSLRTSGTDNAMWRLRVDQGVDLVVRLPRRPGAAAGVAEEIALLRQLEGKLPVPTPRVHHVGAPHDSFPHHWSVLGWIDGTDAWTSRADLASSATDFVADLADVTISIGRVADAGVTPRAAGSRGGPLGPLLDQLDRWLTDPAWNASALIDVAAVRQLADEARESADEPVTTGFVHGDLIPGNLLVADGSLAAVIDWGGAGWGDLAQDLAPAWSVFDEPQRSAFRAAMDVDDAAWIRGRTHELEHAVGGVLYYVPKRHPLGDVMARTLSRILDSE